MLEVVRPKTSAAAATGGFDVEILSVATVNPSFQLSQTEATRRAKEIFPHLEALWSLYANTGIELRYNCQPVEWYLKPHSWEERTAIFQQHALDLLADVTLKATAAAGIDLAEIDILITNTITGLAIPSLDAKLFNRLKFAPTVERLPIFGLGCGGGVAGVLLRNTADGTSFGPRILAIGEWCWPQTEHIMGWDIKDDGFGVVLSP